MILILSDGISNKSIDDVIDWISYYQGECICLNSNEILDSKISFSFSNLNDFSIPGGKKHTDILLNKVNVIWNWRWFSYGIDRFNWKNNITIYRYLNEELNTLYHYFKELTAHKFWWGEKYVNKINALKEAQKCGMHIPDTLITKSKSDVYAFRKQHNQIIVKPISNSIFFNKNRKRFGIYTTKITEKIIDEMPDHFFPILLQCEIKKDYEIRSFFLDGQFYSAAIISQNDPQTSVDFRNYNLVHPNRIIPYKLPNDIEKKLSDIMRNLNLDTGSIDIIYSNGIYYFLEINPVGQFDMISAPCNFMLSKQIAKYLILKDKQYETSHENSEKK